MIEGYYQTRRRLYREKRFALLKQLLHGVPKPFRILDVGGRPAFYTDNGYVPGPDVSVTLLNVSAYTDLPPGFESVVGDGRDLSRYADGSYDVVHSNSVLAYVGGAEGRRRMAAEIQRVGRRFFVQTPNRGFFLDWRTATPFFQYLPPETKARLLTKVRVGRQKRLPTLEHARSWVQEVDDVHFPEFRRLFPSAEIIFEKTLGLAKSFIAHQGFESAPTGDGRDRL